MSTTVDESNISTFQYSTDLKIDPPLPDGKTRGLSNDFLKLKQSKDEDVKMVDGEITVVSTSVTSVIPVKKVAEYVYDYASLKNGLKAIAKIAKDNGSSLDGSVLVHDTDNDRFLRIRVDASNIKVEEAKQALVWPDGTRTDLPKEWEDS